MPLVMNKKIKNFFFKQGAEKADETAEDVKEEDVEDEQENDENEAEVEANDEDMQENDEETALIDELGNLYNIFTFSVKATYKYQALSYTTDFPSQLLDWMISIHY